MIGPLPSSPVAIWHACHAGHTNGKTQEYPPPSPWVDQPWDMCICGCVRALHRVVGGHSTSPIHHCAGIDCGGCSLFERLTFPKWLRDMYDRRAPEPRPRRRDTGRFSSLDAYPVMVPVPA